MFFPKKCVKQLLLPLEEDFSDYTILGGKFLSMTPKLQTITKNIDSLYYFGNKPSINSVKIFDKRENLCKSYGRRLIFLI